MDGFININKEQDWTSFDVVAKLKTIFQTKKVGHAGTLDPLATGVLVCAMNQGTKLIEYIQKTDKEYIATFCLGKISDTYDITGNVEMKSDKVPSFEELEKVVMRFQGEISQVPPRFSALRVNGKRAYDMARNGKDFSLPARKIQINSIKILEYEYPTFRVLVECGTGTYIRSLGHDIGEILETGACMTALSRTRVGKFLLEDSKKVEDEKLQDFVKWDKGIWSGEIKEITDEELEHLKHGRFIEINEEFTSSIIMGVQKNKLLVLMERRDKVWKSRKLLMKNNFQL